MYSPAYVIFEWSNSANIAASHPAINDFVLKLTGRRLTGKHCETSSSGSTVENASAPVDAL